ncbi:hypothetical protein ACFVYC_15650 [Pseudarthrobacter sp. NPDC058329]|uniref:hypothetical protein n=1 Tax=Pseudarthrobacter sp. NPDC058329 TaxID=3346448 RepID=UPI0036DA5A43
MPAKNYASWNRLIGAVVEIRRYGQIIRTGTVEAAMPDSSALWLASNGNNPRTMYEASLGYQAWVQPQELAGTSCYRMTTGMLYAQG